PPPANGPKPRKGYQTTVRVNTKEHTTIYTYITIYIAKFPQKLKRSTRAWGIPRGTTEENKQLTKLHNTTLLGLLLRSWRLASTPRPLTATATLNVHRYCRQDHAVNDHIAGRQQVLTLHRYDAVRNWTSDERRPPRSHLWGTNPALHLLKLRIHTMHSTQPNSHWPYNGRHNHNTHDPHRSEKHATLQSPSWEEM
ncbi:hypothetical protein Taro_046107, partial [Colocasia esculenta]|nr:hypothetical protein [Colocasia esculenta]